MPYPNNINPYRVSPYLALFLSLAPNHSIPLLTYLLPPYIIQVQRQCYHPNIHQYKIVNITVYSFSDAHTSKCFSVLLQNGNLMNTFIQIWVTPNTIPSPLKYFVPLCLNFPTSNPNHTFNSGSSSLEFLLSLSNPLFQLTLILSNLLLLVSYFSIGNF